ncbi:MAG TPA: right-handed parallel beta-helix repeat-containing protein [Polyangiaceae bacterium]
MSLRQDSGLEISRRAFCAILSTAAVTSCARSTVHTAPRLPYQAPGEELRTSGGATFLERRFQFRARGIYYLWIRVTSKSGQASSLAYDLDGHRRFKGARGQLRVEPQSRSEWISWSRQDGFRASVHVPAPGEHTLNLRILEGHIQVERIALTLFFSAKADGDSLDHAGDPGFSEVEVPPSPLGVEGFRDGRAAPAIAWLRAFYVDSLLGNDAQDGSAPNKAWRTLLNVNRMTFSPGDAILLKRGGSWAEGLAPKGSGTQAHWVVLDAYGDGPRPKIDAKNQDAVHLSNQSYWAIRNLEVTTNPASEKNGVLVESTKGASSSKGLRIDNVVASDNGGCGILIQNDWERTDGIEDVVIDNCLAHSNNETGVQVSGPHAGGWRNVIVRNITAYDNGGLGGIYVNGGEHGLIEECLLYHNYFINCWIWNVINVTIRRVEATRGHSGGEQGGFDLDYSCDACTIERCYSRHNQGYGFMLMGAGIQEQTWGSQRSRHNIMRYCVAEEDTMPIWVILTFEHGKVHNNLAIARGKDKTALHVAGWSGTEGGWPADTDFFNNILVARDGALPLWVEGPSTRQKNRFDFDLLVQQSPQGAKARWGGSEHDPGAGGPSRDFVDLSEFPEQTGQEKHGSDGDPRVDRYRLRSDSPARSSGTSVSYSHDWLAARSKHVAWPEARGAEIPPPDGLPSVDLSGAPVEPQKASPIGPGLR